MVFCFSAMHAIAAKRGDGLRPELLDLLKRSRANTELESKSSFPLPDHDTGIMKVEIDAQVIAEPDHLRETVHVPAK